MTRTRFARRLVRWWHRHGRKDLPWQRRPTPYRIWVSEIMLQQTQVATVVPFFRRFIARFPSLRALADAELDEVLAHWSGLGYYARARNLHAAARRLVTEHRGRFPRNIDALMALPGVGRSTAGALLALAHGERHPILDGNVKRVLARHAGIGGWPGASAVQRALWAEAQSRLPSDDVARYTQALMDLGATVCVRRAPECGRCPVADDCVARRDGRTASLPASRPRRAAPLRETVLLVAADAEGRVLLEQQPPTGLWGGLWSLPQCESHDAALDHCRRRLALEPTEVRALAPLRHAFTHFTLLASPLLVRVCAKASAVLERSHTLWYNPRRPPAVGVPAPVSRLLAQLSTENREEPP